METKKKKFTKDELLSNESFFTLALDICTQGYYVANLTDDKFESKIITNIDGKSEEFSSFQDLKEPYTYSEFQKWWLDSMLLSNSEEYKKTNNRENLLELYKNGTNHVQSIYKTKITNGDIRTVVQTTLMYSHPKTKKVIALTIINIFKDNQVKSSESNFNKSVIQSLAFDFEAVFYVNLRDDSITSVRIHPEFLRRNPKISDIYLFSIFSKYITSNTMIQEDFEPTLIALSKKNILREFNQKDAFSINYRIKNPSGKIFYYQIKLVKTNEWESDRSFIIGFHNVDEETKLNLEQLERIKQQSELNLQLNAVINSMSSDYESIFYIEPEKDRVYEYRRSELFKKIQPQSSTVFTSIPKFIELLTQINNEKVADEDKQKVNQILSIRKCQALLEKNPIFYLDFKLIISNQDRYYQAKLVKDQRSKSTFNFIIGFRNIDVSRRLEIQQKEALEEAMKKAEEASHAKSTFLFNMSHDIRTPMNAIIGYSTMAERHIDDKQKVIECLEKVKVSSDHLLKLINDVLDMSRIENGKITIENESFNIKECIDNIVEIEKVTAEQQNLKFILTYKNLTNQFVNGDSFRITQILLNIIGNAIKYTRSGGSINITVEEKKSSQTKDFATFELKIADTGIGMSKEFLKHIFEMFSRERNTTTSGIQGTGLGMAIVKNLVDLMNGKIEIKSELDKGTTVFITLDLQKSKEKLLQNQNSKFVEDSKMSLKNKRVLLVEDNILNREIARDILEEEGIIVEEAADGTIAVNQIRTHKPSYYDFVLMDIQMPFLDGYNATKQIRELKNNNYKKLPIIAMTANAFEEDKIKSINAGMNAHLSKPIRPEILFKTISELLQNQ